MPPLPSTPRVATVDEASVVADLLDRFNREFDTPTPGVELLRAHLERRLAGPNMLALLAGEPAVGLAVLTFRPSVWFEGSAAVLDELYVVPARRGRGIGTGLLKTAEAACRQHGADLLEINVDGEDEDARRFYERHGYANRERGQTQPQLYYFRELARPLA